MFVLFSAWRSRGFQSSRHTSAEAAHGQFTLGSTLKWTPPPSPFSPYSFGLCEPRATKAGKVGLLLSFM